MELPRNQRAIDAVRPSARRDRYRIKDVPGLHLEVHPTGRSVYMVRYQVGRGRQGRAQRWLAIGLAADVSLSRAIQKAAEVRANAVLDGKDEVAVRRQEAAPQTLQWLFNEWADRKGRKMRDWEGAERLWRVDVSPRLGARKMRELVRADVAKLRDDIGKRSLGMGDRAAALLGRILNWGVDAGYLDANPATRLSRIAPGHKPGRVMSDQDLRIWLRELPRIGKMTEHTRTILLLLTLLGQRRTEVAHMQADEIRGDIWTIPASRTKNGKEHGVPLPPWAASVVMRVKVRITSDKEHFNGLLFASRRGPPYSRAITQAMRRATRAMNIGPYSPHDLRRTMTTRMAELQVTEEVRERVINHTSQSVQARHYNRHEYMAEKYRSLSLWEEYLSTIVEPQVN
ncbi:MAG: tyrosine-type recombinase/integrase [Hyphomicrobiaceae bacterium]